MSHRISKPSSVVMTSSAPASSAISISASSVAPSFGDQELAGVKELEGDGARARQVARRSG